MAGQTAPSRQPGGTMPLVNFVTKDVNGNPVLDATYILNLITGPSAGLVLEGIGGNPYLQCVKPGTYTFNITCSNPSGSITTDANGDTGGAVDTLTVMDYPPTSQSWSYPIS